MTSPADPGLQPERTSLAWRRTALSVAVGSLIGLRVLPPELGAFGYVVSVLGLVWSLDLALLARRLVRSPGSSGTPGAALARTALTTAAAAGAALVGVVVITRR